MIATYYQLAAGHSTPNIAFTYTYGPITLIVSDIALIVAQYIYPPHRNRLFAPIINLIFTTHDVF